MRLNYASYRSKKTFCLMLSLLTILNGYALFFAGTFSIGMMIAAGYAVAGVTKWLTNSKKKRIFYSPIWLLIFFIVLTLISMLFISQIKYIDMFYDIAKITVWAMMISFAGYFYFDYKIFARFMIRIAVLATIYLIVQVIAVTFLEISIPNALNFGIIRPTYSGYSFNVNHLASQIRLSSFWMEPAQYGNYVVATLAVLLFDRNTKIPKRKLIIGLLVLGIFLSTSSGAIYMMLIFFILYFLKSKNRFKTISISFLILSLCLVFLFSDFSTLDRLSGMGTFGYSLYRSLTKIELWRDSARIGASFDVISSLSEYGIHKYIGLGVGNEIRILNSLNRDFTYLNSFAKTVTWTGYFGVGAYLLFFLSVIRRNKGNVIGGVLALFCLMGGFYSGLWYSPDSIVFYIIAIYVTRQYSEAPPKVENSTNSPATFEKQKLKGIYK